jgi:hypothetical protein
MEHFFAVDFSDIYHLPCYLFFQFILNLFTAYLVFIMFNLGSCYSYGSFYELLDTSSPLRRPANNARVVAMKVEQAYFY